MPAGGSYGKRDDTDVNSVVKIIMFDSPILRAKTRRDGKLGVWAVFDPCDKMFLILVSLSLEK